MSRYVVFGVAGAVLGCFDGTPACVSGPSPTHIDLAISRKGVLFSALF